MNSLFPTIAGLLPIAIGVVASQETSSSDSVTVWWILGAAGAATVFNQIVTAWNNLTGRFKEREGQGPEYITRANCHDAHKMTEQVIKELEAKMEAKVNELHALIREDVKGAHKRIDIILSAVSKLEGKVDRK